MRWFSRNKKTKLVSYTKQKRTLHTTVVWGSRCKCDCTPLELLSDFKWDDIDEEYQYKCWCSSCGRHWRERRSTKTQNVMPQATTTKAVSQKTGINYELQWVNLTDCFELTVLRR